MSADFVAAGAPDGGRQPSSQTRHYDRPVTLIERSAQLRMELLEFAVAGRYRTQMNEFVAARQTDADDETVNVVDEFLMLTDLGDGRTMIDVYVATHALMEPESRDLLLGWKDAVSGVFEITARGEDFAEVVNLIDDLPYRIRSTGGPAFFAKLPEQGFLVGRILPIQDEFLAVGTFGRFGPENADGVYRGAAQLSMSEPKAVFRNPAKLAGGWEMQRKFRKAVIAEFGSDLVTMPGTELQDRFNLFQRDYLAKVAAAETASPRGDRTPIEPDLVLPSGHAAAESVTMIFDEIFGLDIVVGFRDAEQAFEDPALMMRAKYRAVISEFLSDPGITPAALIALAKAHPAGASEVFRRLLKKKDFSWDRDGEALLRRKKPLYYSDPMRPSMVPLSPRLAAAWDNSITAVLDN